MSGLWHHSITIIVLFNGYACMLWDKHVVVSYTFATQSLNHPNHQILLKAIGHFSHQLFAMPGECSLGHWVQVCAGLLCALWAERSWLLSGVSSQYLVLPIDSISSELWALQADSPWQQAGLSYLCVVKQSLKNKEKATGETNWWARSPCCGCKSFRPCGHLVDSWGIESTHQTGETEWQPYLPLSCYSK